MHAGNEPDIQRRGAKALAMLAENPALRRFVLVEAGQPTNIGVATRGITYGDLEVRAERYDARTLLEPLSSTAAKPDCRPDLRSGMPSKAATWVRSAMDAGKPPA